MKRTKKVMCDAYEVDLIASYMSNILQENFGALGEAAVKFLSLMHVVVYML